MKRIVLRLLRKLARSQRDQAFFERAHRLALAGMNVGGGTDLEDSGELQVLEHLAARPAARAPVVFDVGANRGGYALAARRILGPRARILAFEPSRAAFENLSANVAPAGIEAVRLALGDETGRATLYADVEASGLASLYPRRIDHLGIVMERKEEVPLDRLDAFCAARGIDRIDLLKLDVEGHELAVLGGAGPLLASGAIEWIQFEFGGCNLDSRTYFRDFYRLLAPAYRLHRILRSGFHEVEEYRETSEIFTTTNYLACRRDGPGSLGAG